MKHWKVGNVTGLKADGLKAQEDLQGLLRKFQRLTEMQVSMGSWQCMLIFKCIVVLFGSPNKLW